MHQKKKITFFCNLTPASVVGNSEGVASNEPGHRCCVPLPLDATSFANGYYSRDKRAVCVLQLAKARPVNSRATYIGT
jgi:hypothetical protein